MSLYSSYKEYDIRCMECGARIASHAAQYELLRESNSAEQTFAVMGDIFGCIACRVALENPRIINFNTENRAVIEGLMAVDQADGPTFDLERDTLQNFAHCYPYTGLNSEQSGLTLNINIRVPLKITKALAGPAIPLPGQVIPPQGGTAPQEPKPFIDPTVIGIPTINSDPNIPLNTIYVGAKKYYCLEVSGATYLAI